MLKSDDCANESNFASFAGAIAPGPLFLAPASPSSFASSSSSAHSVLRQRFPPVEAVKAPKDEELLQLSASADVFGDVSTPPPHQLGANGTGAAVFRATQFSANQTKNMCYQRTAQTTAAAQMAHAMAQQLVSVYVPNPSSTQHLTTFHNAQHQQQSADVLPPLQQQRQYSFNSKQYCFNSNAPSAAFSFGPSASVSVPQLLSPAAVAAARGSELLQQAAVAAAASYPAVNAAMVQQQQHGNTASCSSLYDPNFVSHHAHNPSSYGGADPSPSSSGPSSASSLSGAYSFNPSSSNCAAPSSSTAPVANVFFPHLYSSNNSNNDFYGYYHHAHAQCHHHHPFLHHFGAVAAVPQPPPVLLPNNCSASSSSNSSELEHGNVGGGGVQQKLAKCEGMPWKGGTVEERTKLMNNTFGGVTAVSRRAESGTFPGLCPQPRHPVGPGTNNVRVRTKDTYRVVYSECQRQELEQEFDNCNAFITKERKAALSARLRLTERQIKIWFQNRRAKEQRRRKGRRTQTPKTTIDF